MTVTVNPDNVHDLRRRILNNETVDREEVRAAIEYLTPQRLGDIAKASEASDSSRSRSKKSSPTVDLDDLL